MRHFIPCVPFRFLKAVIAQAVGCRYDVEVAFRTERFGFGCVARKAGVLGALRFVAGRAGVHIHVKMVIDYRHLPEGAESVRSVRNYQFALSTHAGY
jgi:hypothetical protein